jgi:hypothetical protein
MSTLTFDADRFGKFMIERSDLKFSDKSNNGWNARNDSDAHQHMAMEYKGGSYDYRTWRPQASLCRQGAAILVSCKVDQIRWEGRKDDHMVILTSVNRAGGVITVQAAIQSLHHDKGGQTEIIVNDPKKDTSVRLKDAVHYTIEHELDLKSDGGVYHLGEIAWTVIQCRAASCVLR